MASVEYDGMEEWEDEDLDIRPFLPTSKFWYDMEDIDALFPVLLPSEQAPFVACVEEPLGLVPTWLSEAGYKDEAPERVVYPCTWIREDGGEFQTFAIYVSNLTLVDVRNHLCFFVAKEAGCVLESDHTWTATVIFATFCMTVRTHSWFTGFLIEFEMLCGEETSFKLVVNMAGRYLREADVNW